MTWRFALRRSLLRRASESVSAAICPQNDAQVTIRNTQTRTSLDTSQGYPLLAGVNGAVALRQLGLQILHCKARANT